jgi:phosphoserine phosphatase
MNLALFDLSVDVICTELEVVDGVLTGRYRGGDCVGPGKAAAHQGTTSSRKLRR